MSSRTHSLQSPLSIALLATISNGYCLNDIMYSQKQRPCRSRQFDACQGRTRVLRSTLSETLKRHTDALLKSLSENEVLKEINEELKKQVNEVQERQQQMESKHKEEVRRNEKIIRHLQLSQAHSESYVADLEAQWKDRFEKLEVRLREVQAEKEVLRRGMQLVETVHMMQTVQTTTTTNMYKLQQERRKEENQTQKQLTLLTNRQQSPVTRASCIVNKRKVDEQAAHKPQSGDNAKRKRVMNTNGHEYTHLEEDRRCSVSKREWMYERKRMNVF